MTESIKGRPVGARTPQGTPQGTPQPSLRSTRPLPPEPRFGDGEEPDFTDEPSMMPRDVDRADYAWADSSAARADFVGGGLMPAEPSPPEEVAGWRASDGTFFETQEDATLYTAANYLRQCLIARGVKTDSFIEHLDALSEQCRSYLDAREALDRAVRSPPPPIQRGRSKPRRNQGYDEG